MQKFIKQNKMISWLIGLGVIVVLFLYLQPDDTSTTTTHKSTTFSSSTSTATTDVEDDDSVHFDKYKGTSRDPFIPGVVADNPTSGGPGSLVNGAKWQLTGINSINGVTSALIENAATQQSIFLQVGDKWSGLRVASISDDAINFVNALGQVTQLGFAQPDSTTASSGIALGSNAPSVNQINPLPPLSPDAGTQPYSTFRQFGRQQQQQ